MESQIVENKLVICIEGQDQFWNYSDYRLSFDSTENEILSTLQPAIEEHFGVSIKDDFSGWLYKTRKAVDSKNIYLIPNSTAGNN
jgi:hypothetical protein